MAQQITANQVQVVAVKEDYQHEHEESESRQYPAHAYGLRMSFMEIAKQEGRHDGQQE